MIWQPVPQSFPGREVLVYICALISLASGVGLLWQRSAAIAARVLFFWFLLWLLFLRLPGFSRGFTVDVYWAACQTAVMLAAAWVLYTWFATDWDEQRLGFVAGENGLRIARVSLRPGVDPIWPGSFHLPKADDCARARVAAVACGMGLFYGGDFHRGRPRHNYRSVGAVGSGSFDFADGSLLSPGMDTEGGGRFSNGISVG